MKLNEFYVAVDGNYEDAMERLRNEMFVGKFLRMLPRDGSMMLLEKAMADGRANDAFRAVHTLKGIALNLSLTKLAAACSQLTEALRGADTIPQQPIMGSLRIQLLQCSTNAGKETSSCGEAPVKNYTFRTKWLLWKSRRPSFFIFPSSSDRPLRSTAR